MSRNPNTPSLADRITASAHEAVEPSVLMAGIAQLNDQPTPGIVEAQRAQASTAVIQTLQIRELLRRTETLPASDEPTALGTLADQTAFLREFYRNHPNDIEAALQKIADDNRHLMSSMTL